MLRPGPDPYPALAAAVERDAPGLLVVDQLEELYTLCEDPEQREAFLDLLVDAPAHLAVVVTLRADHYAALAEHRQLADLA